MANRKQLTGWLGRAGLVMLAFVATSCGDDNPTNPPTTGSIAVTAATTGDEIDADGYAVEIDDLAGRPIAVDGTETFTNLSAGTHAVTLTGVAANCTVSGDNPRDVTVTAGSTASTTFSVTCSATTGELEVTTVTTGDDIDADGYTVSIDGGAAQAIGVNGTLSVPGLDAGDYSVELGDVADNCTPAGDNPRTVSVTAGGTATTQFDVACTPILPDTGDLNVVNVTGGNNPDDAYTVSIDGGAAQALAANDSLSAVDLTVGDHTVELGDVAANCTVAGDNPRTVTVVDGTEVRTQFDVTCTSGSLEVTTVTWGLGQDANGYGVVVDGGAPLSVGINDTQTLDADVGDRSVELQNIAANCTVLNGTNPRTETVNDGATTATQFDVFCWEDLEGNIVFETDRDGDGEIYVRIPGGAVENMTRSSASETNPTISADGSSIAFGRVGAGIWRVDATGYTQVGTSGIEPSYTGAAGPKRIAYVRPEGGGDQIWTMNNDGVSQIEMATTPGFDNSQPAYSPDGNWILYVSNRDGDDEIYVVNVATQVSTRLTTDAGTDAKPAWWFDGSRILWASNRAGAFDVWAADFDSGAVTISNLENLTLDVTPDALMPTMRPDGQRIMYVQNEAGVRNVYTMNPDGTGDAALDSNSGANDVNPAFSPWP